MATSRSLEEFSRRIDIIVGGVKKNSQTRFRKVAFAVDRAVVEATPVDTGRARANWIVTLGSPLPADGGGIGPAVRFGGDRESNARGASEKSLGRALDIIGPWKLGQGTVFISNGVPYIGLLDRGSSRQAPKGMLALGRLAARQAADSVRIIQRG